MSTLGHFAAEIVQRARTRTLREGVKPFAAYLAQISAEDVDLLIQTSKPLRDILPKNVLLHPLAQKLLDEDPDTLLEVLEEINPKLAKVLSTPAGRAWWRLSTMR